MLITLGALRVKVPYQVRMEGSWPVCSKQVVVRKFEVFSKWCLKAPTS